MSFARLCSGHLVMSAPVRKIAPESTQNDPATALSKVDFPEPFVPMMTTNDPSFTVRLTACSACSSLGVPGLNVLLTVRISSMGWSGLEQVKPFQEPGSYKRQKDEQCSDEFQVIGIQSQAQCDCHQEPEED